MGTFTVMSAGFSAISMSAASKAASSSVVSSVALSGAGSLDITWSVDSAEVGMMVGAVANAGMTEASSRSTTGAVVPGMRII